MLQFYSAILQTDMHVLNVAQVSKSYRLKPMIKTHPLTSVGADFGQH